MDSQFNTLRQNTEKRKKKKAEKTSDAAKENVWSFSKKLLPEAVKETLNDSTQLQQIPEIDKLFSSVSGVLSNVEREEFATSIPLDVVDGYKDFKFKSKKKSTSARDTITKFAKNVSS